MTVTLSLLGLLAMPVNLDLASAAVAGVTPILAQASGETVRWEIDDNFAFWSCNSIAVGDHGALLIAGKDYNQSGLSVHSTSSHQPILDLPMPDTLKIRVDAARRARLVAALIVKDMDPSPQVNDIQATVAVWSGKNWPQDRPPDWTFAMPRSAYYTSTGSGVLVGDHGNVVVAWFTDVSKNKVRVRAFRPDGTLFLEKEMSSQSGGAFADEAYLDEAGERLCIEVSGQTKIVDLASGLTLHVGPHRSMFGGQAFSGDGRRYAAGDDSGVKVWEEDPMGDWQVIRKIHFGSNRIGGPLALDADGDRLAYMVFAVNPSDWLQLRYLDLKEDVERFRHEWSAVGTTGGLWGVAVRLSDDGSVVAGASQGDSFDRNPTGFVFDADGTMTAEFRTAGSARSMDMDPSGQVVVIGTKDAHTNHFGNGGDIICADTRMPEVRLLGYPAIGNDLDLEISGGPAIALLAAASALGHSSTRWGETQLNLDRLMLVTDPIAVPITGYRAPFNIPLDTALIGSELHVQGVLLDANGGGRMTNRVSMRVLP